MFESIDDITINYEDGNVLLVKELDKEILSKGAWTTIVFKYQEWSSKNENYGKEKYTIRRYRKINGEYQQKSKFNISSPEQAKKLISTLQKFLGE
jgi:hypothetical protein